MQGFDSFFQDSRSCFNFYFKLHFDEFKKWFFQINYHRCCMIYFVTMSLLSSLLIYTIELNNVAYNESKNYVDCLFTATSAATATGLITLNTQLLRGETQLVLLILFISGSPLIHSFFPVVIRRFYFKKRYA